MSSDFFRLFKLKSVFCFRSFSRSPPQFWVCSSAKYSEQSKYSQELKCGKIKKEPKIFSEDNSTRKRERKPKTPKYSFDNQFLTDENA